MTLKNFFGSADGIVKETIDFLRRPTFYGRALMSTDSGTKYIDIKNIDNISVDLGQNFKSNIISVKFTKLVNNGSQLGTKFSSSTLKQFQLYDGLSSIPASAFNNCSLLTEAIIPDTVKIIGNEAFKDCVKLENVMLGTSLLSIENNAFQNCTSLKYICIPNTCESIKWNCFDGCTSLKYAIIGDNEKLSIIHQNMFNNCTNLSAVNFGKNINVIAANAFKNCHNLRKIKLPNSLEQIGVNSFDGVSNCEELFLPNSLKHIAADSFSNFNVNCKITYAGTKETLRSGIFSSVDNTITYPFGFSAGTVISCSNGIVTVTN